MGFYCSFVSLFFISFQALSHFIYQMSLVFVTTVLPTTYLLLISDL